MFWDIFPAAPSSYIKHVKQCIDKEYIFMWYNFQACCIAGHRDITARSEL